MSVQSLDVPSLSELTFTHYNIGIAFWSRAGPLKNFMLPVEEFPLGKRMATAADWMSAASFISMAGIMLWQVNDGSVYLNGMDPVAYVLSGILLAPYLRKFWEIYRTRFLLRPL